MSKTNPIHPIHKNWRTVGDYFNFIAEACLFLIAASVVVFVLSQATPAINALLAQFARLIP